MTYEDADKLGPPAFTFYSASLPKLKFEARPVSVEPKDGTVALMYRRTGKVIRQAGVGQFKDGRWTNGKKKELSGDLFWTVMVDV